MKKIKLLLLLLFALLIFPAITFALDMDDYIDIDVYMDVGDRIISLVAENGPITSPLRIVSGGSIYGLALVDPADIRASNIMIMTNDGIKALRNGYCGNGVDDDTSSVHIVEECDDGNNTSGDGCSDICICEGSWTVPGTAPICPTSACYDGTNTVGTASVCVGGCCIDAQPSTNVRVCSTTCCPSWTPSTSSKCSGVSFTQTDGCGSSRSAIGTKNCCGTVCPSQASVWGAIVGPMVSNAPSDCRYGAWYDGDFNCVRLSFDGTNFSGGAYHYCNPDATGGSDYLPVTYPCN